MTLTEFILECGRLEEQVHTLAAAKYDRECSLLDFEDRTAVDKQLQRAYSMWPDYKEVVDNYDKVYARNKKFQTIGALLKTMTNLLTADQISEILSKVD